MERYSIESGPMNPARRPLPAGIRRVVAACLVASALGCAAPPHRAGATGATTTPASVPLVDARGLAASVTSLRREVDGSPILDALTRRGYQGRLATLAGQALQAEAMEKTIGADMAIVRDLDTERATAVTGIDRLRGRVNDDLRALDEALSVASAPVTVTASTTELSATVALTGARIDLQTQTAGLTLDVQTGVRLLSVLALDNRVHLDARQLSGRLDALARQLHLGLSAVIVDLRLLQASDPTAAADAQAGLAAGLTRSVANLSDTLTGKIDGRQSLLRAEVARLQGQVTRVLDGAALAAGVLRRDVLASEIAVAPLSSGDRAQVAALLDATPADLRAAAAVSARLTGRLDDLGALQEVRARIERDVQKAQSDLDGELARSDAALQGTLRADVTVAISDTEQTVHAHLDSIDVGALARDLNFDVKMGLSVLRIAALHAEVTPGTSTKTGGATRITGVDMVLRARLQGLQARIRIDVAGVRDEQERLAGAVRARMAVLRSTVDADVAPAVAHTGADVTALQQELGQDLGAVTRRGAAAHGQLATMAYLTPSWGRVGADILPLRRTPATNGKIAGWAARGSTLRLVGYVWGWSVRDPRTGVTDDRWYVLRDPTVGTGSTAGPRYVYAPLALVAASPAP